MKVIIYPYDKNPYQSLLYRPMRKKYGFRLKLRYMYFLPVIGALHVPLELMIRRLMGFKIIHIHWIAFYLKQQFPHNLTVSWYVTRLNFWWMKQLGYKIIWTVHDITPHQVETSDDLDISKRLALIADKKIIHSTFTREQLEIRGLNNENCVVIEHGNYDGVYPDTISQKDARAKLGIQSNKRVILFFGIIKSYKGVGDLLDAYDAIATKDTMLVIAGRCNDEALINRLNKYARRDDVILRNQYIPDCDVAIYFKASDLVCLPFKAITTSGSTLLSLTFGKPIVAPCQGSLKDLPADVGYLYDPASQNALEHALHRAVKDSRLKMKSLASRRYADSLAWDKIAEKTYGVYEGL